MPNNASTRPKPTATERPVRHYEGAGTRMSTSRSVHNVSRRTALGFAAVAAVFLGMALLAAPASAVAGGKPQFYTDEFHFQFARTDQTAICGFPVWQTLDGYVHGWDRYNADGSYDGGNVQVTITGAFFSDAATVPFRAKTRNIDIVARDGSAHGVITGILALVTVPGQGAVEVVAGRLVITPSPGGGEPTFAATGQNTEDAFFGSPGHPGTLCALLAG